MYGGKGKAIRVRPLRVVQGYLRDEGAHVVERAGVRSIFLAVERGEGVYTFVSLME